MRRIDNGWVKCRVVESLTNVTDHFVSFKQELLFPVTFFYNYKVYSSIS